MEITLPLGTTRDLSLSPTYQAQPIEVENVVYTIDPQEDDESVELVDNEDGTARITGLNEGDCTLRVSADAVIGAGTKQLVEAHVITVVPTADELNVQFSDPYVRNEA